MHFLPAILREGRILHNEPAEIEDEDEKVKFMKIKKAKDPFEKRLKPILEDKRKNGKLY